MTTIYVSYDSLTHAKREAARKAGKVVNINGRAFVAI